MESSLEYFPTNIATVRKNFLGFFWVVLMQEGVVIDFVCSMNLNVDGPPNPANHHWDVLKKKRM